MYVSQSSLHDCDVKPPNYPLYEVGEHISKIFFFFFLNLDTVLSDLTPESFANIWQIELNWITSMKLETVRTHFRSDVFGLSSSRNFATMATWRNGFSVLSMDTLPAIWMGLKSALLRQTFEIGGYLFERRELFEPEKCWSATQPFLVSSRNGGTLRDDTKNGCVVDYRSVCVKRC